MPPFLLFVMVVLLITNLLKDTLLNVPSSGTGDVKLKARGPAASTLFKI